MPINKKAAKTLPGPAAQKTAKSSVQHSPNGIQLQRARLLDALAQRAVTTLEARAQLDIMHPAMRVRELREAGHLINTVWIIQATECGASHRVAKYVLVTATPARRRTKRGAA
jgi:hypothetical protein